MGRFLFLSSIRCIVPLGSVRWPWIDPESFMELEDEPIPRRDGTVADRGLHRCNSRCDPSSIATRETKRSVQASRTARSVSRSQQPSWDPSVVSREDVRRIPNDLSRTTKEKTDARRGSEDKGRIDGRLDPPLASFIRIPSKGSKTRNEASSRPIEMNVVRKNRRDGTERKGSRRDGIFSLHGRSVAMNGRCRTSLSSKGLVENVISRTDPCSFTVLFHVGFGVRFPSNASSKTIRSPLPCNAFVPITFPKASRKTFLFLRSGMDPSPREKKRTTERILLDRVFWTFGFVPSSFAKIHGVSGFVVRSFSERRRPHHHV